jgi:hypothetical protein
VTPPLVVVEHPPAAVALDAVGAPADTTLLRDEELTAVQIRQMNAVQGHLPSVNGLAG